MTDSRRRPSDAELRARLTPMQYEVTQRCGTEPPFSGRFWDHHEPGRYDCVVCGQPLFESTAKFDSGTGWPSFFACIEGAVTTRPDRSHGMLRLEIRCASCDAHLGHVFDDGPPPTGLRHCVNSAALAFEPATRLPR